MDMLKGGTYGSLWKPQIKKEETTKKEETKKDDKETKKLEGTLKVVTTGDAYQPLFDKFTEEVGPKVEFISMSSGEVLSKLKAEGGTPAKRPVVRGRNRCIYGCKR